MKFDTPATTNPIDQLKVVGQPPDRIDGPLKTTGTAPYAYERHDVAPNAGLRLRRRRRPSPRAASRSIDLTRRARPRPACSPSSPRENAGKLGKGDCNTAKLLGGPEIEHYHQAIALVVAETFEQARAAAQLVRVDYDARARARSTWRRRKDGARSRETGHGGAADTARRRFRRRLRRRAGASSTRPTRRPTSPTR